MTKQILQRVLLNYSRSLCFKSLAVGLAPLCLGSRSDLLGDLGTTAREVEEELERNFALASRWGCILLLDEADVFLSARERMDFTRNGLVAGELKRLPR